MADQTVPSLTHRLAAYMVEAFLDGRGYDPGDRIDVEVTLKEGFHTVLTEMREDQAAGTATYDGLLPSPPPGEPDEGEPHPWLCPHGATLLCMVCGDLSSGDNKE